jgi:hypothetical protein
LDDQPLPTKQGRWAPGWYAETAWQHDERARDDLRLAGGVQIVSERGWNMLALGLGGHALFGQHGVTGGADIEVRTFTWGVRAGVTHDDGLAMHVVLTLTLPAKAVAILVPLAM